MLDLKLLAENTAQLKKALAKKHFRGDLDTIIKMDEQRRALMTETEDLKAEQNRLAKEIPTAKDKEPLLAKSKNVKEQIKELEPKLKHLEENLHAQLLQLPNPPLDDVPEGKDDSENVVIHTRGDKPDFNFQPKDHAELGKMHDLIDIEAGAKTSGARFWYLKNEAVLLQFALVQFVLNKLTQKGFSPIVPPVLVREEAMEATGFFPADRSEIYHVNPGEDDLYLAGTSEVPLCMLNADKILKAQELPIRYTAYSTCFRREAGTYGKDTGGIIRGHQFDKIEMFSFCHPDKSEEEHQFILSIEEEIMQELGFHYQVVNICGGDLGAPAAKKYDIEVWLPGQNAFRELTSSSNCTDFQSRRAKIRFNHAEHAERSEHAKRSEGTTKKPEKSFVHTLNGTAIAIGRTLIALLETHQQEDGTIRIPEPLQPYMAGRTQIGK